MSDLIPFILSEEQKQLKAEIDGVPVAVIFDGTLRLVEALAIIVRFVDRSSLKIQQRLLHMQLLAKSLSGEEVARELLSVLSTEYGVVSSNLVAVMRDRASVNSVSGNVSQAMKCRRVHKASVRASENSQQAKRWIECVELAKELLLHNT